MIKSLDHIAIAVSDLPDAIRRLTEDFGVPCSRQEDVRQAQTTTAFFPLPPTRIELVHPLDGGGPIQKFLEQRGKGGLHHICFRSDNIEEDVERLRARGYEFLSETPQPGAHGSRVIFIHPRSCDGVLVEINEPAADETAATGAAATAGE